MNNEAGCVGLALVALMIIFGALGRCDQPVTQFEAQVNPSGEKETMK